MTKMSREAFTLRFLSIREQAEGVRRDYDVRYAIQWSSAMELNLMRESGWSDTDLGRFMVESTVMDESIEEIEDFIASLPREEGTE